MIKLFMSLCLIPSLLAGDPCSRFLNPEYNQHNPICAGTLDIPCATSCESNYVAEIQYNWQSAYYRCQIYENQYQQDVLYAWLDYEDSSGPFYQDYLYLRWQVNQAKHNRTIAKQNNKHQLLVDDLQSEINYQNCVNGCCH